MATTKYFQGTGKRKNAIARVFLSPGEGKSIINKKEKTLEEYFGRKSSAMIANQALEVTGNLNKFNIMANLEGGGLSGQAEALRNGIAKALLEMNPDYRKPLRKAGYLTRDARIKERKKYGLRKARKATQFSKR